MNTAQLTNTELNIIFASIDSDIKRRNENGKRTTAEKRLIWFDLQLQKVVNKGYIPDDPEVIAKYTFAVAYLNGIRGDAMRAINKGDRVTAEKLLSTTVDDAIIEYNKDEIIDSATAEIKEILNNIPFEVTFKLEVTSK